MDGFRTNLDDRLRAGLERWLHERGDDFLARVWHQFGFDGDDFFHDVLMRIMRNQTGGYADLFDDFDRAEAVIWTSLWRQRLSLRREEGRRQKREQAIAELVERETATRTERDEDEAVVALAGCLQALNERQRRVLLARYREGEPQEAIAQREGMPLGTLKSQLYRARAELRECLESKGVSREAAFAQLDAPVGK